MLKKALLSLFVLLFILIGFGSCGYLGNAYSSQTIRVSGGTNYNGSFELDESWVYCIRLGNYDVNFTGVDSLGNTLDNSFYDCYTNMNFGISVHNGSSSAYNVFIYKVNLGSGVNSCPEVNTGEILSGYVSESLLNECILDLNSCNSYSSGFNNLLNSCNNELNSCNSSLTSCLQYNCPTSGTGDIVWSNLYINDILHIGSPSIFVNIPEEFNWDYSYSTGYMTVDIEGYNVDSDYIEGIINIQNSKPSQGDLNKLVSEVLPLFVPGLIVILFLYFIFKFIKKVF